MPTNGSSWVEASVTPVWIVAPRLDILTNVDHVDRTRNFCATVAIFVVSRRDYTQFSRGINSSLGMSNVCSRYVPFWSLGIDIHHNGPGIRLISQTVISLFRRLIFFSHRNIFLAYPSLIPSPSSFLERAGEHLFCIKLIVGQVRSAKITDSWEMVWELEIDENSNGHQQES